MRSSPTSGPMRYERLVDRLLASPHYGERWGRHWLDLARYADSNGYTRDFGRQIWKYRDWVIDAINRDLPFDQFTIEQLAGDMLPEPTQEQLVATGFHRNTLINEEGGTDQEQFRVEAVVDRVNTTGSVWLGLTRRLCPLPHAQVRPDHAGRVLPALRPAQQLRRADDRGAVAAAASSAANWRGASRFAARSSSSKHELEKQRPGLEAEQREWEATVTPQQRARLPGPVQVAFDMKFEDRDDEEQEDDRGLFPPDRKWPARRFRCLQQIFELREQEPKIPTTMILRERAEPRETFVHKRGDFLDRGPEVIGGVPAVLPPLTDRRRAGEPARFCPLAGLGREPADAARGDESRLAEVLRPRPGRDRGRFRHARHAADASGAARLAGDRSSSAAAGTSKAHAPADRHEQHLSPVVGSSQRSGQPRSAEQAAGRQSRLRLDAEIVRDVALAAGGPADADDRRPERLSAAAGGRVRLHAGPQALERGHRRRPLPPRACTRTSGGRARIRCC